MKGDVRRQLLEARRLRHEAAGLIGPTLDQRIRANFAEHARSPRPSPAPAKPAAPPAIAAEPSRRDAGGLMDLTLIRLGDLRPSALNVRTTDRAVDIEGLAEDIAARGLKQNLVVHPAGEGRFEVVAGGRRLAALLHLVDAFRLTLDHQVPCLIEDEAADGRETSLAENIQRVAMNPADEFVAFATIMGGTEPDADQIKACAARFGVTTRLVEQRLRLAALAPPILEALRAGQITLEAAKAYATFADQQLQEDVYRIEEQRGIGTRHAPANIRASLKNRTYPSDIPQALYVGLIAYHGAGGRSQREMFMGVDAGGDRLLDPALVDQLAREKAAGEIDRLVKRDGLAGGVLMPKFVGSYTDWPKTPAGHARAYGRLTSDLNRRERKSAIAVFSIAHDGSELVATGCFLPVKESQPAPRHVETPAERAQRQRDERVTLWAARLAVPSTIGTGFEGRTVLPGQHEWLRPIQKEPDGSYLVTVQVRMTEEELAAHRAAAQAKVQEEDAAPAPADEAEGDARQAVAA